MEYELLGLPPDGPTLRLDHERFSYAGKFVMSATGKSVARDRGTLLGAVAFDADRTDEDTLRLRYVTVRHDRRGEGIGPRLLRFTAARGREHGFEEVRIAVNNPFAFEASYRAGLAFTGERTGLAELECADTVAATTDNYQRGLDAYRERDLSDAETAFLDSRRGAGPPAVVDDPGA